MSIKLLIIYPVDPFGSKIGGGTTFIKGFIKNAPKDIDLEFIGISSDQKKRPSKKFSKLSFGEKEFAFFPLFLTGDENRKTIVPLSIRFALALKFSNMNFSNRVIFFNKLEPALVFNRSLNPFIAIIHSDITKEYKNLSSETLWSFTPKLYSIFETYIFSKIDHVYTVSRNTFNYYQSKFSNRLNDFSFLPTWIDSDVFYLKEESKISIRNNLQSLYKDLPIHKKWILFAGRLQKVKAPFRLIDTFIAYLKTQNSACLILVGEGNLKNSLKAYVQQTKINKNVFFLGSINQKTLSLFYNASDVLLLTSNSEGMPFCVLEALGCGLPVVSTNIGDVKRIVKNNYSGEIVESSSPEIISQALNKVLSNRDLYCKHNFKEYLDKFAPHNSLKPVYEKIRRLSHNCFPIC